jgi:hypothetical protein
LINDSQAGATGTPGEGQVFTDDPSISPFVQPFMNSAIRALYRELRNCGDPALVFDNFIISGLTPVYGANGLGNTDPATQVYVGQSGYYDGNSINPKLALPNNMLNLERVWERQTGTNTNFIPMKEAQFGLESRPQYPSLIDYEWRNYNVNMVGSTQTNDIRLRYWGTLPTFYSATLDFASTYVPILDCTDAVAYKIATMYARMLGSPGLADLAAESKEQMFQLKNAVTRRKQAQDFLRIPYGHSGGDSNNFYLQWQ